MSFTTRCPACSTMFKVVPDQLKISDGWVRCGHCADVFDATLYLEPWTPPEEQVVLPDQPEAAPPDAQTQSPDPSSLAAGFEEASAVAAASGAWSPSPAGDTGDQPGVGGEALGAFEQGATDDLQPELAPSLPSPEAFPGGLEPNRQPWLQAGEPAYAEPSPVEGPDEPAALEPSAPTEELPGPGEPVDFEADLKRFAAGSRPEDGGEVDQGMDQQPPFEPPGTAVLDAVEEAQESPGASDPAPDANGPLQPLAESEALLIGDDAQTQAEATREALQDVALPEVVQPTEPEFVLQARRRAYWRSPAMRVALSLLALTLGILLAGQWALHERDRLAAQYPQILPVLQQACGHLGCEVGAVRNIDAIVIDSSTLARKLGHFYSFDLVLKNQSPLSLAVPAVELSLTDIGDKVISRRVFLPEELPGLPPLLPAQDAVSVSLRLSLAVDDAHPMAGYRVLVFYP